MMATGKVNVEILIYKAECMCVWYVLHVSHKMWQTDTKKSEALEQMGAKRSDVLVMTKSR